jgi:Zn-finger nucleic acid-binding protein
MTVPIDYCPKIRGIWLEKDRLEKILETSTSPQQNTRGRESNREGNQRRRNSDDDEGGISGFLRGILD